jgi:hypothetical protein
MSLVEASSMQHEDDEPEQMMPELSIGDQVQTENFNQNNVQQVLLVHNIALRRNFDDVRVILPSCCISLSFNLLSISS